MPAAQIAFQSSPGRFSYEGVARLINAYAEKRDPDSKGPLTVQPSDGLIEFVDTTGGPGRGMIYMEDLDKLYAIGPSSAYKVTYSGGVATSTRIGTVPGTDIVQLSRNQKADPQVVVNSAAGNQVIESDALSFVTDTDLPATVSATYVSGYTVYGIVDRRFFISSLNSSKLIDALDFATAQQKAGKLIRVDERGGELVTFNSRNLEFWRDTGNADFPFEPISFQPRGLMAKNSAAFIDSTLMFVGDDGVVYRLTNYTPVRISTHYIERLIQDDASQSGIKATAWTKAGHAFYCLTGSDWSECFDATTQVWHSRESYGYDTWRGQFSVQAWGKTLVQDKLSGKIFYLDSDTYAEDTGTMIWGVDSPPLHVFPNGGIVDALHIDIATGYGLLSGQGSNPLLMLQTSTDGGNTFGNYRELELGVSGKTGMRVTARRLGRFGPKGITFRLRISDPVVRSILATDVDVRPLAATVKIAA